MEPSSNRKKPGSGLSLPATHILASHGKNRDDIAKHLGCSGAYISMILGGKRRMPDGFPIAVALAVGNADAAKSVLDAIVPWEGDA